MQDKKIALIATDMVEEVELTKPWQAVKDAGGQPELRSIKSGEIQAFNHYDKSNKYKVDKEISSARMDDYDGLVIPGGVGNPDTMRMDQDAVEFVRSFFEAGKPVAVICHGPWMLVEADVARGRKLTSWPSLKTDIRNAGGNWVDEEVVRDSSRRASRTTCPRFARSSSRNSGRACTRASGRIQPPPRSGARAGVPCRGRGGGSSVGRAPGCGPGGRGFKSRPPPLAVA